MIDLDNREFTTLCLCAFRYAIDRETGISYEMSDLFKKHRNDIPDWAREQMIRDIERKLQSGQLTASDKLNWKSLMDELQ